jgi:hypothetical protein
MIGLVLALSGLALLGAAVALWLRHSRADSGPPRPVSIVLDRDQDLLPESGNDAGKNGLAAFYAYQMAVGKIDRPG